MALIADRYVIHTPTGSIVVATHPVFVLGMVMLGPLPMLVIGQLVIFANRPSTKGRLAGNSAFYAIFLTAGALLARVGARAPRRVARRLPGSRSPSSRSSW